MGLWTDRALPPLTDLALRSGRVQALRAQTCAGLAGRVLELGFGAGPNLAWLPPSVTVVEAIEPSDVAWRLSAPRRQASRIPVQRSGLDGQHLDLPTDSCDAALITFSLCTIPDPMAALAGVRRVLRPGAPVHLLEHGAAPEARVRRWQQRLDPLQQRLFGGCHLTSDLPGLLAAAGFEQCSLEADYLAGPRLLHPWTYCHRGTAA